MQISPKFSGVLWTRSQVALKREQPEIYRALQADSRNSIRQPSGGLTTWIFEDTPDGDAALKRNAVALTQAGEPNLAAPETRWSTLRENRNINALVVKLAELFKAL